jgi:hypothetical protein
MRDLRAIVGGAASSSALTTVVLLLIVGPGYSSYVDALGPMIMWFLMMSLLTAVVAGTVGLAWHAFASRNNWRSVFAYIVPASLAGGVVPLSFLLGALGQGPVGETVWAMLAIYGAVQGGLTGFFAWLIRRPDRDQVSPASGNETSA